MPTPSDPPRVAVEVTREELMRVVAYHAESARTYSLFPEAVRAHRVKSHRVREAELRKVMEGMDG